LVTRPAWARSSLLLRPLLVLSPTKKWYSTRELQTNTRQARLKKIVRQARLCQISMQSGVEASVDKHVGHKTSMGKELPHTLGFCWCCHQQKNGIALVNCRPIPGKPVLRKSSDKPVSGKFPCSQVLKHQAVNMLVTRPT
jgi:hypothetical protein